ncbi:hypothetical protein AJ79_03383 [Helicocarpus griseus UAMH5409]|uniref:Transcription factor domain-containing protein n=1 Tax=Helicocarpus griseus UAMH5409 TaxID=1447875 RepID=A0A2B7XXZ3_9EURO|nr:hypothetical protein AJ79_03383 [Helicocarpus griseus UAMH5409]
MRNEWPLALHEDMICTRLPASESNFQSNQPIQMDFLANTLADSGTKAISLSPFAQCIVLSALYGRCMAHRQQAHSAVISGLNSSNVWTGTEWLAVTLQKWTQQLADASSVTWELAERDPMLTFTHMLAHSAIIHIYYTIQILPSPIGEHPCGIIAGELERRAYQAASYTARLAKAVPQLSCFKASTALFIHTIQPLITPLFDL